MTCILYDYNHHNSVLGRATTVEVPIYGRLYFIGMISGCKGFSIDLELSIKVEGKDYWGHYGRIEKIDSDEPLCLKPFYTFKTDKIRLQLKGSGNPVIVAKLCESLDFLGKEKPSKVGFVDMTFPTMMPLFTCSCGHEVNELTPGTCATCGKKYQVQITEGEKR